MVAPKLTPPAKQCRDELNRVVRALSTLGLKLGTKAELNSQIETLAADLVGRLSETAQDADVPPRAAKTADDLMNVLWPNGSPEDCGQPDWWMSSLGRLCARNLRGDDRSVSHATAAAMLGVSRGTIGTLTTRGRLAKHEDGGVSRASILDRLGWPWPG